MASFVNSFALLEGSAPREPTAPSKKKKSKKNKTSTSSALPPSDQGGSAAAAPGSEDDTPVDDGFQVAGKSSKKGSASNFKDASPARKLRSLMEGIADLETASRQAPFRDNTDRVAQWRSWRQQVTNLFSGVVVQPTCEQVIESLWCLCRPQTAVGRVSLMGQPATVSKM